MPRATSTSKASDGAASSSAAGDEEKTINDENRKRKSVRRSGRSSESRSGPSAQEHVRHGHMTYMRWRPLDASCSHACARSSNLDGLCRSAERGGADGVVQRLVHKPPTSRRRVADWAGFIAQAAAGEQGGPPTRMPCLALALVRASARASHAVAPRIYPP